MLQQMQHLMSEMQLAKWFLEWLFLAGLCVLGVIGVLAIALAAAEVMPEGELSPDLHLWQARKEEEEV